MLLEVAEMSKLSSAVRDRHCSDPDSAAADQGCAILVVGTKPGHILRERPLQDIKSHHGEHKYLTLRLVSPGRHGVHVELLITSAGTGFLRAATDVAGNSEVT